MDKNIEYYLSLPYRRELIPEPEGGWFIRIVELPGCMSQGETVEEANRMIEDAMRGWLQAEIDNGSPIPEPRHEEEFSGKFVVRVAKSLHRKIDDISEREGVSLNQWINTVLAESAGNTLAKISEQAAQPAPSLFSGLSTAIEGVLLDVGLNREKVPVDEVLFSRWLEQNLMDIRQDCQSNHFEDGLTKIRDLIYVLKKHTKQSPIMHSIHATLQSQMIILESTCAYKNKAEKADQMRLQISSIIRFVNTSNQLTAPVELNDQNSFEAFKNELFEDIAKEK